MEPLFFKAENRELNRQFAYRQFRFNGAAFFQSGKCAMRTPMTSRRQRLQWSRFFSKRKITIMTFGSDTSDPGFNGAAFFQSGKSSLVCKFAHRHVGFNGAAFFQSGKCLGFD